MGEVDKPHRGIFTLNKPSDLLNNLSLCMHVITSISLACFVLWSAEKIPNNSMRIVMESDSRKRPVISHDGGLPPKKPWFDK